MHTSMSHTTIVRHAYSAALFLASTLAFACGSDAPPKLVPLDLSPAGMNATIDAPQGATVAKHKHWSGVTIMAPSVKQYGVSISESKPDLARTKSRCTDAPQKNCTVVSEQSDAIMTKWKQLGSDNYKVVVALGPTLVCETDPDGGWLESRTTADSILTTCRSFKTK